MKKIFILVAVAAIFFCIFYPPNQALELSEEDRQIEAIDYLNDRPTYYVEGILSFDGGKTFDIDLYRDSCLSDGSLPPKITVRFSEQQTPSAKHFGLGDSIKLHIRTNRSKDWVDSQYVQKTSYESDLFVFVDQIPALYQKRQGISEK